jgi:type VI secretion system secreted protein VgrG
VWWRVVSSATLGTNTSLIGNILAYASITLATGAKLNGRALAQTGAVTLASNTITGLICLTAGQTATPTNTRIPATQTAAAKTATAKAKATARAEGAAETQAAETPVVPGLPGTGGGAPIRNENLPWSLVMVGGLSAIALALGVRAFRRTYRPKQ